MTRVAPQALLNLPGHATPPGGGTRFLPWLEEMARAAPTTPAIEGVDGAAIDRAGLHRAVTDLGDRLLAVGAGRGQVVLSDLGNGPDALVAWLGAASVSTVCAIGGEEPDLRILELLDMFPVAAVMVHRDRTSRLRRLAQAHGLPRLIVGTGQEPQSWQIEPGPTTPIPAEPTRAGDGAVIAMTSGTTGMPKAVAWSQESVMLSARALADWMTLGAGDRSLCVMPLSHLHALVRSLLPVMIAGGTAICAPGLDPARVLGWLETCRPTLMTGSPAVFRTIADRIEARGTPLDCPGLTRIASGSDALDPASADRISRMFGVPLAEFYGQSEIAPMIAGSQGGIVARQGDPTLVGPLMAPWTVAFRDDHGVIHDGPGEGEILIRGGLANPVISGPPLVQGDWIATGDTGRMGSDGALHINGRVHTRINRGGRKIEPITVELALERQPGVREALVFALPDPVLGARVAAAIVGDATPRALQAALADSLPDYMIPDRIVLVDALPRTETGKLRRDGADRRFAKALESAALTSAAPATQDPLTTEIAAMMGQLLELSPFDADTDFFAAGGNSFVALNLMLELQDRYGVELTPGELIASSTAVALAALVRDRQTADAAAEPQATRHPVTLRTVQTGTGPMSLILAHAVDGSAPHARPLARTLGPEWTLHTLEATSIGRELPEDRDTLPGLRDHARNCADAIRAAGIEGPYCLAGHSFGAHLALEIAQALVAGGAAVPFVGILDDEADWEKRHFAIRAGRQAAPAQYAAGRMMLNSNVLRPYPGDAWLFRAVAQPESWLADRTLGWSWTIAGTLTEVDLNSDHLGILRHGAIERTAEALAEGIAQAVARYDADGHGAVVARHAALARSIDARPECAILVKACEAAKDGDLDQEIGTYWRALSVGADLPYWAYRNLGDALVQRGDVEDAEEAFRKAVDREDCPIGGLRRLSAILRETGRMEAAEAVRLGADIHDAPNLTVKRALAQWDMDEDRPACAAAALEAALDLWPDPLTNRLLIDSLVKCNRLTEARAAAERAVELEPAAAAARLALARLLERLGDLATALNETRTALSLAPSYTAAYWIQARLLDALNQRAEAIASAKRAVELSPQDANLKWYLTELMSKEA
ncbi:MAG: hypothetical protein CML66_07430 [Rhodobacteraceae bacterium]|nr:hypothetical protein [Paracoccaceae bacterium]